MAEMKHPQSPNCGGLAVSLQAGCFVFHHLWAAFAVFTGLVGDFAGLWEDPHWRGGERVGVG